MRRNEFGYAEYLELSNGSDVRFSFCKKSVKADYLLPLKHEREDMPDSDYSLFRSTFNFSAVKQNI